MRVGEALLHTWFIARSHAIQYRRDSDSGRTVQVSVAYDGALFAVCRSPSRAGGAWPAWVSCRGSSYGRDGTAGLWLPHVPDLIAACELVPLALDDRPPPFQRHDRDCGHLVGAPIPYPTSMALAELDATSPRKAG